MPSSSSAIWLKAREEIAKDRFRVEVHSNATGWLEIGRVIETRHTGIACIVPIADSQQRIHLAVDEITAARITKAGDALAAGHTD
ncbi:MULTISPECIES: hypothetical protein [unclassified Novosphingobium]|uniref:hypothetical protein n=1 Tax=unclassified Novosphingobium TaxID=2644732 RepID=UPI000D31D271|nr:MULTISPECIES: hypothetical protein [unclassified Novosphingobium]PTR11749.1 hypothetical protein C8K11_104108 [Novosphingobium sp. GV055]PUB04789.1 hypothetical protein C8K12_104108 [Novosphingobium sp. GV061]PUB21108.1 hypothetical protein C8K14_104108 [Novosphingobium sp. GV079]PUB42834.1 hypothetical protein C8K10_104108 [Novosphingobium sp. GV027]